MADQPMKHQHSDDDIIIKDQDGTYKILVDGKFVPLDEAEQAHHAKESTEVVSSWGAGPKRSPEQKNKKVPVFKPGGSAGKKMKPVKLKKEFVSNKPQVSGFADQNLNNKAQAILDKSNITFASGELRTRAVNALIAQLKGVRKLFETKQTLIKSVVDGGVGLQEQEAEALLLALSGGKRDLRPKIDVQLTKEPKNPVVPPIKANKMVGQEVRPPAKVELKKLPPISPAASVPVPQKLAPQAIKAPKPAVADVQVPRRAPVGPIDELSYSLVNWRRLGDNPLDRVKKIENQLGVLEQEKYADRLAGLKAWHKSEVVKLYLQSGQDSLESGKALEEMLTEGSSSQLSFEEWQAIADLDERLRG